MSTPLRALIVEDSEADAQLISQDLRRAGYDPTIQRVDTSQAMTDALAAADWDVIISDHRMPRFSSLAALKIYKERGCDMPFLVVSGSIGEELAVSAMKAGAHDYIMKDNLTRLAPAVERELREAKNRQQRRQAEQALAASRLRTESILQVAGEGICGLDASGVITFINTLGAKLIGWQADELIGKSLHEMLHHTKPNGAMFLKQDCSLCATLQDGLVHWMDSEMFWRKDGSGFPAEYVCTPIRENDKVTGAVLTFQDISRRHGAESALQESHHRLERTLTELQAAQQQNIRRERLGALAQMACGTTRDFNNALSRILESAGQLLNSTDKLNDNANVREQLRLISTTAQDAVNVARRLGTFCRPRLKTDVFQPVDLNALIQEIVTLTEPKRKQQAQANAVIVEIRTELQRIPAILGNESELREALTNLVFNAVEGMPTGGIITLRTRAAGASCVFECSDTGRGMTAETREKCLEPFFTTKREHGAGLGLSVVHGIVQRHRGSIEIESEVDKGSTFRIHLPIHTAQEQKPTKQKSAARTQPLQVLIVEDDAMVRKIEAEYLTSDGHAVETAASGTEGLKKFKSKRFDLVISDRAMPEMNGDQMAGMIKTISPQTHIILATGFADALEGNDAKPDCVDQMLAKPFTQEALRRAVAMVAA